VMAPKHTSSNAKGTNHGKTDSGNAAGYLRKKA
jgi:hypothetical protein